MMMTPPQLCFLCKCIKDVRNVDGIILEVGCAYGATTVFLNKYLDAQGSEKPTLTSACRRYHIRMHPPCLFRSFSLSVEPTLLHHLHSTISGSDCQGRRRREIAPPAPHPGASRGRAWYLKSQRLAHSHALRSQPTLQPRAVG